MMRPTAHWSPVVTLDVAYKWLNCDTYWDEPTLDPLDSQPYLVIEPRPAARQNETTYPPRLLQKYPLIGLSGAPRKSRLHDPLEPNLGVRTVIEQLALQLGHALRLTNWSQARERVTQLEEIAVALKQNPATDQLQLAEVWLVLGRAYNAMGEKVQACDLFDRCAKMFTGVDTHAEALSSWMAGTLCMELPEARFNDGIVRWQHCWEIIARHGQENRRPQQEMRWYRRCADLLFDDLQNAIAGEGISLRVAPADSPPTAPQPTTTFDSLAVFETVLRLGRFPVYQSVQAGPHGGFMGAPTDETLALDRVLIDGAPYRLFGMEGSRLRPVKVVSLNQHDTIWFVRVQGDSMDQALPVPIEEGDYVAVRLTSEVSDHRVVVAQIESEMRELIEGAAGMVIKLKLADGLYSQSSQDYPPLSLNVVASYLGEVVAVAKPARQHDKA